MLLLLLSCSVMSTLCSSSMPGFPVLLYLLAFAQIHVHWIGDAVQPSHPLLSPSPPACHLSQHQGLSSESALHIRWPNYWSFNFSISPSNECTGLFPLGLTGLISLQSKGFSKNLLHPGSDEGLAAFFNICRRVLSPLETLWLQWVT